MLKVNFMFQFFILVIFKHKNIMLNDTNSKKTVTIMFQPF